MAVLIDESDRTEATVDDFVRPGLRFLVAEEEVVDEVCLDMTLEGVEEDDLIDGDSNLNWFDGDEWWSFGVPGKEHLGLVRVLEGADWKK